MSSGWRPGMLLNILQCTTETSLPLQQKIIKHKMSIVLRLRNCVLGICFCFLSPICVRWKFVLEPVLQFRIIES